MKIELSNLPAVRNNEPTLLYRGHEDSKVGGVCAALGHRYGFDPVWLRIGFLAAMFGWGVGLLPYIILWIAIPATPKRRQKAIEEAKPQNPEEVPKELVEAWNEVNDITEGR